MAMLGLNGILLLTNFAPNATEASWVYAEARAGKSRQTLISSYVFRVTGKIVFGDPRAVINQRGIERPFPPQKRIAA